MQVYHSGLRILFSYTFLEAMEDTLNKASEFTLPYLLLHGTGPACLLQALKPCLGAVDARPRHANCTAPLPPSRNRLNIPHQLLTADKACEIQGSEELHSKSKSDDKAFHKIDGAYHEVDHLIFLYCTSSSSSLTPSTNFVFVIRSKKIVKRLSC